MIYAKVLFILMFSLLMVYYIMVIGHLFGWLRLTKSEIELSRLFIPFYYWKQEKKDNRQKEKK